MKKKKEPAEGKTKELSEREKKKLEAAKKRGGGGKQEPKQGAAVQPAELSGEGFGSLPLIQSQERTNKVYSQIKDLTPALKGGVITLRARISNVRGKGNLAFLLLRQSTESVQGVISKSDKVNKDFLRFVQTLSRETIVEIEGILSETAVKIETATRQDVELQIHKLHVLSNAANLPLLLEDAGREQNKLDAQDAEIKRIEEEIKSVAAELEKDKSNEGLAKKLEELTAKKGEAKKFVDVDQSTKLDYRWIDLRTPANQAIFRMQSAVCQLFRDFLLSQDFFEIHSPKIIGAASEGGANVFTVKYFDRNVYMAQSPQFYKQMGICSDFERVFEIGPVFRAEDSNTHRHLTEFTGLDMEMAFYDHYHEVLDILDDLFVHIFEGLEKNHASDIALISQQYSITKFEFKKPSLRLNFWEGIALLREAGVQIGDFEDFSTAQERTLGKIVKEKYGTDFYMLDKFPLDVRPFYTMDDPADPRYSNSYDFFMRGEEIVSGAQRIHDADLLLKRALAKGVDIAKIAPYLDSFKYGISPHAGCGVGLERVVMLYLGLNNIRKTSMFPRDPHRLTP
eukprot:TRINITY_DN124_c0_g1_i4.p1 TRINITY_DN124_c0_g1~~TRINITY_DN124_c0_g1_i4.p1  ORF type:complete len:567 (-),score=222.64 TRINITY_DN124_c0_g1_i4:46-1746(-)